MLSIPGECGAFFLFSRRLLKSAFPFIPSEARNPFFDQNARKREIPHFADSVRNDEFEVFQQATRPSDTLRNAEPANTKSWK